MWSDIQKSLSSSAKYNFSVRAAEEVCQEGESGDLPRGLNTPLPGGLNVANVCPAPLELKDWDFIFDSLHLSAYFEWDQKKLTNNNTTTTTKSMHC